MLLFAHLAVDAYNGTGNAVNSLTIRAPQGWTPILTTDDDGVPSSVDGATSTVINAIFDTSSVIRACKRRPTKIQPVGWSLRIEEPMMDLFPSFIRQLELFNTSIPLGLGLSDGNIIEGFLFRTTSYLQTALNFYEAVVNSGIDPSRISFAGHSLGGMAAGYLAGITGSQGMIFASGPQNEFVRDLGAKGGASK